MAAERHNEAGQDVTSKLDDSVDDLASTLEAMTVADCDITLAKYVGLQQFPTGDVIHVRNAARRDVDLHKLPLSDIKEVDAPYCPYLPGHGKTRMAMRAGHLKNTITKAASACAQRITGGSTDRAKYHASAAMTTVTNAKTYYLPLALQHPVLRSFCREIDSIAKKERGDAKEAGGVTGKKEEEEEEDGSGVAAEVDIDDDDSIFKVMEVAKELAAAQKRVQNKKEDAWVNAIIPTLPPKSKSKSKKGRRRPAGQRSESNVSLLRRLFEACGLPFRYAFYAADNGAGAPDIAIAVVPEDSDDVGRRIAVTKDNEDNLLASALIAAIIEVKQDLGRSGNAKSELHVYYAAQVQRCLLESEFLHSTSKMPCILSVLAGPNWRMACGVVETTIMMERVGANNALCAPKEDPYNIGSAAARLRAWARAVDAVATALLADAAKADPDGTTALVSVAFPHVTIKKEDGQRERVRFVEHLARGAYRATWNTKAVVFKATLNNNDRAQRLLASRELAPQLYASESVVDGYGRQWKALVMEDLFVAGFLDAATLSSKLKDEDKDAISAAVRKALDVLHDAGLVFFDLRMPNVMVKKKAEEDGAWEVRLVDFEMCGKVNTRRPAKDLNPRLRWPKGSKLTKDGDAFMLKILWSNVARSDTTGAGSGAGGSGAGGEG